MSETSTFPEASSNDVIGAQAQSAESTEPAADALSPGDTNLPGDAASTDVNRGVDSEDVDDENEESDEEDNDQDGDSQPVGGRRRRPSLKRLEEEGEVAADYLEELLDIVDLDGDIDIDVENDRASVAIVGEGEAGHDLRRLVGANGEVLEALQDLARLSVQARTGERSRLMLDIAGHRAARRRRVEDIAARACQEVQRTGEPVALEAMSAFERKVAHDVVAEAGLVSESEGEDPGRHVVVHPARG